MWMYCICHFFGLPLHKNLKVMGLLDNYSGIGMSPRPHWRHQIAMSNMLVNAKKELQKEGLLLLTEATVTDDWDDLAPDLVVFDANFHPLSIIEITRSYQLGAIMDKCEELMTRFPKAEYFVYDYEENILYFYDIQALDWISSEEYEIHSHFLSYPVIDYFE